VNPAPATVRQGEARYRDDTPPMAQA